jgi:DNA-binding MarR family transcriptional regulator
LLDDGDQQLFGRYGLTGSRYYVLFHLGEVPGLSVSQLSTLMFCDKSNITRLVRAMEGEGLVSRHPHETDGRALRLYLTDQGDTLRACALRAHRQLNDARFGHDLQAGEQSDLLAHLRTLKLSLEQELSYGSG